MSQAVVNTMPGSSQSAAMDTSSDVVSLRNFVVDEDRANLGSDLWKTIDKSSFILAQREALEAFNMAKAIRLSEQTVSSEQRKTNKPAPGPVASSSTSTGSSKTPPLKNQEPDAIASSLRHRRPSQSQAIPIPRRDAPQPPTSNDEVAARSLARSWQVDGIQTSLLENRGRLPQSTSSITRPKPAAGLVSQVASSSLYAPQTQSNSLHQEKKPPISQIPTAQNVSLSTLSSSTNSHRTQSQVNVVSSSSSHSHHTSGHHSRSHSHSVSHSHSRTPSQLQAQPQTQMQRVEPRPILKRDPATLDGTFSTGSPPTSSRPHPTRSSSASASADANQQKRRKASISVSSPAPNSVSVSSQVHYPYSTSNYSHYHPYNPTNGNMNTTTSIISPPSNGTSQASVQAQVHQAQATHPVVAPAMSEFKKQSSSSSASSKEIQSGQMINPVNAGSSSVSAPPSRPSSKETSPQVHMAALPSSGTSSASAQAAAAERENQRSRSSSRRRDSVIQLSCTAPAQPSVQTLVQAPIQAQDQPSPPVPTQQHAQGPRDIFAPTRFNCSKCSKAVHSVSHAQPAQALTSQDPFSHPFTSSLHLTCPDPSCGTTHCRGCLKAVKCRDSINENESGALVLFSTSPSKHPPKFTPTSCGGGPGCPLWTCCQEVKSIAVWEALRAFDAVFAGEAGFVVGGTDAKDFQHQALGRQHREAYVKLLISKADKSMRKFEDAFVRTLRVVCSWLQPSYTSLDDDEDDDDDDDDEEEDDEDEAAEDVDQHKREERDAHENQLLSLFRSSYLLEVLHAFLSNNKPRDWIAHSETYIAILEMMRRMLDSGLGAVLNETPTFSPSGSSASAPASAVYTPFATPSGSTSSSASSSPSSSQQQPPVSLYDLIKQLEKHRSPLMNLASRMQFSATVDKVNNLCDAISYLLLQQMVG